MHTLSQTKTMAACFSRCALHAAKPRHLRHFWFRVSQFASSHRFWNKNYGLSMWRPRPRYEWRFVKHQRTDDLPQSVLTVDSHCQSTCKVCVQSSVNQSFISCGAELLTARHLICASKEIFWLSKFALPFRKATRFCCLPTWLPFIFAAKSVLLSRVSLAKGYPERAFFPPTISLRKERSFKFSTRFSSSSFANANGAVCQKLFHEISHLPVSSTRPRVDGFNTKLQHH